jgi:hypothetical protein
MGISPFAVSARIFSSSKLFRAVDSARSVCACNASPDLFIFITLNSYRTVYIIDKIRITANQI